VFLIVYELAGISGLPNVKRYEIKKPVNLKSVRMKTDIGRHDQNYAPSEFKVYIVKGLLDG